jgi:hypothetical protein
MLKIISLYFLINLIVNFFNISSKLKIFLIFVLCLFINIINYETEIMFIERFFLEIFYLIIIINFYTIWNSSIRIHIMKNMKNIVNYKYSNEELLEDRIKRFGSGNKTIMQKNIFLFITKIKLFFMWIVNEK